MLTLDPRILFSSFELLLMFCAMLWGYKLSSRVLVSVFRTFVFLLWSCTAGFGLASHLGVLADIPTVGIGKNVSIYSLVFYSTAACGQSYHNHLMLEDVPHLR